MPIDSNIGDHDHWLPLHLLEHEEKRRSKEWLEEIGKVSDQNQWRYIQAWSQLMIDSAS